MKLFKNISIAEKLRRMLLFTTGIALLIAAMSFVAIEVTSYRKVMMQHLSVLADFVSINSTAAIAFSEEGTANKLLNTLQSQTAITAAVVYLENWQEFATYNAMGVGDSQTITGEDKEWIMMVAGSGQRRFRFTGSTLDLLTPIGLDGETIGYLFIKSSLDPLYSRIEEHLIIIGILFVGIMGMVYFLASALQRRISGPINKLVEGMNKVSSEQDYSLRLLAEDNDEVGALIQGFNNMLSQVQQRDDILARHRQELEEQVRIRTADMSQAKELAEAASRAKSDFLATMSHEIRTPMHGVLGMTELLLGSGLEDHSRKLAGIAHRSAEALLSVINDILDFSRIEAGKLQIVEEDFDLHLLLQDSLELVADHAYRKGLQLVEDFPEDLPRLIRGDSVRLRQILLNLLGNAVKFTEAGKVQLTVIVLEKAADNLQLTFIVSDTGPGIALEKQSAIFDAFTQGDSSTTRRYSGSGLGLAITHNLVTLMGGSISIKSVPGEGALFRFTLGFKYAENPDARIEQNFQQNPLQISSGNNVLPTWLKLGGKILLAEDNPVNQEVVAGMLEVFACQVDIVNNGQQAISAITDNQYDLVLMDCHMPVCDGFDAVQEIRRIEQVRHKNRVPVIALTADIQVGIVEQCKAAGMDDCLIKPFQMEALQTMLKRWLSKERNHIESGTVSMSDNKMILDSYALEQLRDIGIQTGKDVLTVAIKHFLKQTPDNISRMKQALEAKDATLLWHVAHGVKSAGFTLGANGFSGYCAQLEAAARAGQLGKASELVVIIERLWPNLLTALTAWLPTENINNDAVEEGGEQQGKLLLVDDDPSFLMLMATILQDAGFIVDTTTTGSEALQKADTQPPDMVLLDGVMEDMDGFTLCERLRVIPGMEKIPIFMVTGMHDAESKNRACQANATGLITKPVDFYSLIDRLRQELQLARQAAQS